MANGLFSMPTPEQVRANARREAREQALFTAGMAPGRAGVALAGQAGALFGEAFSGQSAEEQRAAKFQNIQRDVSKWAAENKVDLGSTKGQIDMISESIRRMGDFPEQQAQAIVFLNQLKSSVPAESERYGDFEPIPGTNKYGQKGNITGRFINLVDSSEFDKMKDGGKGSGRKGERPATPKAEDLTAVEEAISGVPLYTGKEGKEYTFSDFANDDNADQYRLFIAERTKAYIADAENRGETMSEDVARDKAIQDAAPGLKENIGRIWDDLSWTPREAKPPAFGQQTTETLDFGSL